MIIIGPWTLPYHNGDRIDLGKPSEIKLHFTKKNVHE